MATLPTFLFRHRYTVLAFFFSLIWVLNLGLDIMEMDAAQYAAISCEMAKTGEYLQVQYRGEDYLDKPPLLFWLSSAGISIYQNTNFGYKLPSVLFLLLSLWGTFRFARLWYNQQIAWMAVAMLATTQAYHLMSNDIRTDGLLTTFVILSVYGLSAFLKNENRGYLVLSGLFIGGAMLAKGPVGAFIPAVAIGGHLIASGQWKRIFRLHWLIVLIPVLILLAPMCYGLYMQFDLHPEKEVYGLQGPSGLKFYFWTQSFGRITGENYWANDTPWYYFLLTMLWDLQPWVLFIVPGVFVKIKSWWKRNNSETKNTEWISLFGFVIPFIALSFSNYKLPHYIFPLFPFAVIMGADFISRMPDKGRKGFEHIQLVLVHILMAAGLLMLFWIFPHPNILVCVSVFILYACLWWWRLHATSTSTRIILSTLAGVLIFQLILSDHFYPHLMRFQSTSQVGKYVRPFPEKDVFWLHQFGHATEYYAGRAVPYASGLTAEKYAGQWIYIDKKEQHTMPPHIVIREFDDFSVTRLSWPFLNPATRDQAMKKMLLVEINGPGAEGQ